MQGDLIQLALAGQFDLIAHGANCFNTMAAGIAKQIRVAFPEANEADLKTIRGDRVKLGTYSVATVLLPSGKALSILNCYTQYKYWGPGPKINYAALERVFSAINRQFQGKHLGIPYIGAGLAGGKWHLIEQIILRTTTDLTTTVVTLPPTESATNG